MGRPKGSKNVKSKTRTLNEAIEKALAAVSRDMNHGKPERVQGVAYLRWLATDQPKIFGALLGRLIPKEVHGQIETGVRIIVSTGIGSGPPGSALRKHIGEGVASAITGMNGSAPPEPVMVPVEAELEPESDEPEGDE